MLGQGDGDQRGMSPAKLLVANRPPFRMGLPRYLSPVPPRPSACRLRVSPNRSLEILRHPIPALDPGTHIEVTFNQATPCRLASSDVSPLAPHYACSLMSGVVAA